MVSIILFFLLLGLFFYSKLQPHANILNPKAAKVYSYLDGSLRPLFSIISRIFPIRWEIGPNGLKLDFGQIILFAILLFIFQLL